MKAGLKIAAAAGFALALAVGPLAAHHGSAGYDTQKTITITGVIVGVEWVNPHTFLYINAKNADGQVERWALEGSAPNFLIRTNGWNKDTLKPGMEIAAIGFAPRTNYPCCGSFESLSQALADSPSAVDRLKAGHILQVGEIRLADGPARFGMGPHF